MSKFEFSDEELIKNFQDGDIGAYNQIVYRYKDRLINFIYRFVVLFYSITKKSYFSAVLRIVHVH